MLFLFTFQEYFMNLILLASLSAKKIFLEMFLNFQSLLNVLKLLALWS